MTIRLFTLQLRIAWLLTLRHCDVRLMSAPHLSFTAFSSAGRIRCVGLLGMVGNPQNPVSRTSCLGAGAGAGAGAGCGSPVAISFAETASVEAVAVLVTMSIVTGSG